MDIVAVSAGRGHTVGLKSDGTVVAVGKNFDGQCNVSTLKDIVAISADRDYTFALKADGSLCVAGKTKSYDFSSFRLFNNIKTVAQEIDSIKEKSSMMAQYRMNGLCQYCGGEFSGVVNKKCVKCGKTKDYAIGI
jgi:alpha-tubulin suppressor-like RCC1 family protein